MAVALWQPLEMFSCATEVSLFYLQTLRSILFQKPSFAWKYLNLLQNFLCFMKTDWGPQEGGGVLTPSTPLINYIYSINFFLNIHFNRKQKLMMEQRRRSDPVMSQWANTLVYTVKSCHVLREDGLCSLINSSSSLRDSVWMSVTLWGQHTVA